MDFTVNSIIKCVVTGIEKYGIFVKADEYSGLIHISEISEEYVKDINDFVKIDEEIYCKILEINEKTKTLKLSIKDINYNLKEGNGKFKETIKGFSVLKDELDNWIKIKIDEMEEESTL